MNLSFYQAECGDAARIQYMGTDDKPHNILIDGGHNDTFAHVLAGEIKAIQKAGEAIDLWVVSHIHDDHIGGVAAYISAINAGTQTDLVKAWYYNHPRADVAVGAANPLLGISAKSIAQGDVLAQYLVGLNKMPAQDINNTLPTINLFGLSITILSPNAKNLATLRKKYPAESTNAFEQHEKLKDDEPTGNVTYDYHTKVAAFDLTKFIADDSVENGSGIAMLTVVEGKTILWLADVFPATIVASLKALGYSSTNKLVCDYVKVTHHGSKGNNSNELYEMIECSNYIMSVNGENIYCLPTKECMVRILRCAGRPKAEYQFYFPYDNKTLRSIFTVDGASVFKTYNFKVHYIKGNKKMINF